MRSKTTDGNVPSGDSTKYAGYRRQTYSQASIRKLVLLGITNLLVAGNVWAVFGAPSQPVATSVCSNSVSLSWLDPNPETSEELGVQVQRSMRGPDRGFRKIASLPAYTTNYTDTNVEASSTYYYRVVTLNAKKRKFRSEPIAVTTPAPVTVSAVNTMDVPDTGGSSYSVGVTAAVSCDWSAESMDPWITINNGTAGIGSGTITYSVAENTNTASRTGTVLVAKQPVRVAQAGKACKFTLSPTGATVSSSGTAGSFTVMTGGGCKWTATAGASWIHTSATGNGSGTVNYTVDANTGTSTRTGTISVGGQSFTINQSAGGATITTSASPSAGGTTGGGGNYTSGATVTVTATPNSCYQFANWMEGGVVVSASASYSFTASANRTLVAYFSQPSYAISTSSSPTAGGSTSGGGSKVCGTSVTVTATPNAGYNFVNWTEGGVAVSSSSSYSFIASANRTLVANFSAVPTYTVGTSSSPVAGGSTSGGGNYVSGSTATVVATPNSCYNFVNWTENGSVVSTSATYTFTATGNRTLVANFAQMTYTITTGFSPSGSGTTSGGGNKACGSSVTISATSNAGYNFANWTENGTVASTSANYTFTAGANRALVANFSTVPTYTITTGSSPSAGGTTSGGGTKTSGTVATVTATANSGYTFVNWTENGTQVSTSATYSFTVTGNRTLVANFSASTVYFTITMNSSPSVGGSTSGGGVKASGTVTTVGASANSGYTFVNWTENGTVVSTSASYSFTVTGNRTLVANFSTLTTYAVATSSSPAAGGTTSGGGSYASGSTVTVTATPNSCYNFVSWTEGGVTVSTSASYSFTANANRTLVANFSQPSYTISTSSSPTAGGSTSGGGSKVCGTSVTVTATPSSGYLFSNWTEGGTVVSSSANYTFTASAGRTLVANFEVDPVITTSSSPTAGGSTSGGGMYLPGATVTVLATPNGGYAFVNWTESGTVVSTLASYTFTATVNRSLVANFTTSTSYTITTSSSPTAGGTTSGGGTKTSGSTVTVVATANSGYSFVNWTENGVVYSTSASYNFTANANRILVANFTTSSGQWGMSMGSTSTDMGYSVGRDASGNIFVAGYFNGAMNFGGGAITSAGGMDAFVAKYSPSGAYVWAKRFGGAGEDSALSLAVDASGNVYVTGYFSGTASFDTVNYTSVAGKDAFLVKLSGASGALMWSRPIGGVAGFSPDDKATGVAVDPISGDVVLTGSAAGAVDFGGGQLFTPSMAICSFLAKYNSAGGYLWANLTGPLAGISVTVDNSGNIFQTRTTSGSVNSINKFTSAGVQTWSYSATGSLSQPTISAITIDGSGNVLATGQFGGITSFGSGITATNTVTSSQVFTLKLSGSTGSALWVRASSATVYGYDASGLGIATDASGNVLVTGAFNGSVNFAGVTLNTAGGKDVFVKKYSSTGTEQWVQRFGGASFDLGYAVTCDSSGNVVVTGTTNGGDFGGETLPSAGGYDIFLMKLAP